MIVALGLLLRLVDAGARLNHDEGYSWLVASAGNVSAFASRLARYENTPPLFYLLLAPLPLDSEFWLRFPSIIAGTVSIAILYAIVRPLLGSPAALLAALGLAVAPFAVSFSDYARGFMVADLGLLVALLGAQRIVCGGSRRWWWAYVLGGTWAMYSEYFMGLYLAPIVGAMLLLCRSKRRDVLIFGALPFIAFLPWLPELIRSLNLIGKTKTPLNPTKPSASMIRDAIVPLFFGQHGTAGSHALRDAQAVLVIGILAYSCGRLWQAASRRAFWLLAGVLVVALALQLLVTAVDTDIFIERYMTAAIPLAAAVVAGALSTFRSRAAVPLAAAALAALGIAIAVFRAGREYEPNSAGAVAVARVRGYRTILTNSAVVAFYGRDLRVIVDRPFGIGSGEERLCAPACAIVDDARFGGVRAGPGPRIVLGPLVIRFPPREA